MGPGLKLKLNTANAPANGAAPQSATPATPSIKFSLGPKTPAASDSAKSAKPASKKRQRSAEDDGAETSSKPKKHAALKLPPLPTKRSGILKLSTGNQNSPKIPTSAGLARLKIKGKGKPPVRPLGAGYDSEAEDAEEDPAIEENVVLRMQPGSDCDYLRQAIENRTVGLPVGQGGADVYMRFFKHRRATIVIRGSYYAAVLMDLPCIVESMKSYDKRGWWKSADICQMLYVFEKVDSETQAEKVNLPMDIDTKTWLWPHGLTPPLHNVRKRRFRKRVSYRTIEAAEDEVQRLLSLDAEARTAGGGSEASIIDVEQLQSGVSGSEDDDEDDADGPQQVQEDDVEEAEEVEEEDPDALEERFLLELGGGDSEDALVEPSATADDMQDATKSPMESAAPTSASGDIADGAGKNTVESSDDDDDDDDDEDDVDADDDGQHDGEEVDEEARDQAQMLAQQRSEILHLQKQLDQAKAEYARNQNTLITIRIQRRMETLEKELANKKRSIGELDDDDA